MRVDDQTRVTNTLAAAIEYIGKGSVSSLATLVKPALLSELRGAIAIVSVAAKRELEIMTTPDLERLARHALDTLRLRRWEEFDGPDFATHLLEKAFVVIARELTQPPFDKPRLATEEHETTAAPRRRCDHCAADIDGETGPICDVAQIEPVAKDWPGGNFIVRVKLQKCADGPECTQWVPLNLCQQCFEYVTSEVAQHIAMYGDQARRSKAPQ